MYYDIHPLVNPSGTTLSNCFTTTNGSPTVTITFPSPHSFVAGDIILFSNFSTATNSNYAAADFDDIKFMVTSVQQIQLLLLQCLVMKQDQVQLHLEVLNIINTIM